MEDAAGPDRDLIHVPYIHATGFAANGRGGNDAGVVLPGDGLALSDRQRLAVAAKLGFSETAFISSLRGGARSADVSIRYFTPTAEVELCGHATIASLGLLHSRGLLGGARAGTLNTRAGTVRFSIRGASSAPPPLAADALVLDPDGLASTAAMPSQPRDAIFMQQLAPTIEAPLSEEETAEVARALFPDDPGSTGGIDVAWPPRVASTGLRDLMVAVHPEQLFAMRPDMRLVSALSRKLGTVGIHAFAPPPATGSALACDYTVRNFAPLFGVDEESATGTSNCALACALWASGTAPRGTPLIFSQGEAMGKPSRITVLPPAADVAASKPVDGVDSGPGENGGTAPPAGAEATADAEASSAEMYRPWVGGEHALVGSRVATLPSHAESLAPLPLTGSSEPASPHQLSRTGSPRNEPNERFSAAGGGYSPRGSPMVRATPGGLRAGGSSALVEDLSFSSPLAAAISDSLGISVPSPAGCPDCVGSRRGAWGETFCRRCGRPYKTAMAVSVVGATGDAHGWCDAAIGAVAIWVHRTMRGAPAEL